MIEMKQKTYKHRIGFTLIEVLVVVTILIILTSILVPRLRMITQERNIREASRVVGSMFSQASQRGVTDGVSGVILLRNPNFVVGGFQYAATQVGLLRRVPDYRGDTDAARASFTSGRVTIPEPLEQDELDIVLAGDSISFGSSAVLYDITTVVKSGTNLELTLGALSGRQSYLPSPAVIIPGSNSIEFTIHRVPRLLRSSLTDLPEGHVIDLRFSGCANADSNNLAGDTVFSDTSLPSYDVVLLVDDQGKFDRMLFVTNSIVATTRLPTSSFYAFVTAGETDLTANPLSRDTNLWVSLSNASGIVNVGYNTAQNVALGAVNDGRINDARSISNLGSAAQ